MKLTKIKYKQLEESMAMAGKSAKISNYKFICAMLYIIENDCKWRTLPKNMEIGTRSMWNLVDGPETV